MAVVTGNEFINSDAFLLFILLILVLGLLLGYYYYSGGQEFQKTYSDSANNPGLWIKRNDLIEITIQNKELKNKIKEMKYMVQPAVAEIGVSFNLDPYWNIYNLGGEIRIRITEAAKMRHFIYPRFAFRQYILTGRRHDCIMQATL